MRKSFRHWGFLETNVRKPSAQRKCVVPFLLSLCLKNTRTKIHTNQKTMEYLYFLLSRNLVDSASSHMLVSRIKPCKPKSNWDYRRSANGSLYQKLSTGKIAVKTAKWITSRNAKLIHVRHVVFSIQLLRPKALVGRASREWLAQRPTPAMAASKSDESNHSAEACFGTRVPTNFCPISFWR